MKRISLAIPLPPFRLLPGDRARLEKWARSHTTEHRVVRRSRILLLLDEGLSARAVARLLATSRHTVDLWRRRAEEEGIGSITKDRPGRGRPGRAVA